MVSTGSKRTYQDRQLAQNPHFRVVHLRCLSDESNSSIPMLDEGPFPHESKWQERPASIGRQRILALLRKVDADGLPVYVALEKGVRLWDPEIKRFVDAPTMTPELEAAHKRHLVARDEHASGGRILMEAEKKKHAEQAAATKNVVVDALGELLGEAKGKRPARARDGE